MEITPVHLVVSIYDTVHCKSLGSDAVLIFLPGPTLLCVAKPLSLFTTTLFCKLCAKQSRNTSSIFLLPFVQNARQAAVLYSPLNKKYSSAKGYCIFLILGFHMHFRYNYQSSLEHLTYYQEPSSSLNVMGNCDFKNNSV